MTFKGMELFEYQKKAANKLIESRGYLLAYQMGLGKTIIALEAARLINKTTLVVAPAFMKRTWEKTIEDFFPSIKSIEVVSWNSLKDISQTPHVLIFDESHYMKNPTAIRSKTALKLCSEVHKNFGHVWLLSGTPAKNTSAELWTQFRAINQVKDLTYINFAEKFSKVTSVKYGGKNSRPVKKYYGIQNALELREMYAPFMEVLKTEQVLELPQQIKSYIYNDCSVFSEEDIQSFKLDMDAAAKSEHFSTLKAMQAKMNVKPTISKIKDLLDEFPNKKIVVFTDHLDTADELSRAFECHKITGQVGMDKRSDIIEDFKENSSILVCTVGAAGVGLNLQFANIMIFNDLPWVPGDLAQAEKRIHRIGQTDKCYYFYVLDTGLGALIYKVLVSKIQTLKEIA